MILSLKIYHIFKYNRASQPILSTVEKIWRGWLAKLPIPQLPGCQLELGQTDINDAMNDDE